RVVPGRAVLPSTVAVPRPPRRPPGLPTSLVLREPVKPHTRLPLELTAERVALVQPDQLDHHLARLASKFVELVDDPCRSRGPVGPKALSILCHHRDDVENPRRLIHRRGPLRDGSVALRLGR